MIRITNRLKIMNRINKINTFHPLSSLILNSITRIKCMILYIY